MTVCAACHETHRPPRLEPRHLGPPPIDGLVAVDVWRDDNPKYVSAVTNRVVRAAGTPEITLAIIPTPPAPKAS